MRVRVCVCAWVRYACSRTHPLPHTLSLSLTLSLFLTLNENLKTPSFSLSLSLSLSPLSPFSLLLGEKKTSVRDDVFLLTVAELSSLGRAHYLFSEILTFIPRPQFWSFEANLWTQRFWFWSFSISLSKILRILKTRHRVFDTIRCIFSKNVIRVTNLNVCKYC